MKQTLTIDPMPPAAVLRVLSPNGRGYWSGRWAARQTLEWYAYEALRQQALQPMPPPVSIQMLWTFPQARKRDADNLVATGKCLQDLLVRAGILVEDHAEVLHLLPPVIQVERGVRRLEIILEAAG